jgi:hypothetical protein
MTARYFGFPIGEMFNSPNLGQGEIYSTWADLENTNTQIAAAACGGCFTGYWDGALGANQAVPYYAGIAVSNYTGWARQPYHIGKLAEIVDELPKSNVIAKFTSRATNTGFPGAGNFFEVFEEDTPRPDKSDESDKWLTLASQAVIVDNAIGGGAAAFDLQLMTATRAGTLPNVMGFANCLPGTSIGTVLSLNQFGSFPFSALTVADAPMCSLPPIRNAVDLNDKYPGAFTALVGVYTRSEFQNNRIRMMRVAGTVDQYVLPATDNDRSASRRARSNHSFRPESSKITAL